MVVYEVNLQVQADIAADYRRWLDLHVREILGLPGFLGAEILREESEVLNWSVRYRLSSRAALQQYFDQHAARLRADGLQRFGQGFSASRRILHCEPISGGEV